METKEPAARRGTHDCEESWIDESQGEKMEQETVSEPVEMVQQKDEPERKRSNLSFKSNNRAERTIFVNGLAVGLGIGCIATFIIMWIAVFFSPQLPSGATYETMLPIFIYSLIYLLAVGLIALTTGIVRQYYIAKTKV